MTISFIQFDKDFSGKKILKMGFEEGYKMGLTQLQELLKSK